MVSKQSSFRGDSIVAFLSHRQTDWGDRAHALHQELFRRFQINTWFDQKNDNITQKVMREGVKNAKFFVLFVSPKYISSENCQLEVRAALDSDKPIILIYQSTEEDLIEETNESNKQQEQPRFLNDITLDFLLPLFNELQKASLPQDKTSFCFRVGSKKKGR